MRQAKIVGRALTGAGLMLMVSAARGTEQAPFPVCTGETVPCWQEVSDRPGCYVWNQYPKAGESVSWSGDCEDGTAAGEGVEYRRICEDGGWKVQAAHVGHYVKGKREGNWGEYNAGWRSERGDYVKGKREGSWSVLYYHLEDCAEVVHYVDGALRAGGPPSRALPDDRCRATGPEELVATLLRERSDAGKDSGEGAGGRSGHDAGGCRRGRR